MQPECVCVRVCLCTCACVRACVRAFVPTGRHHGLHPRAVDEGPLDGLGADVGPVDALLHGVVVHHRHVVDVGHREGDDVVVVRVVDVHAADLYLTRVQQELTPL